MTTTTATLANTCAQNLFAGNYTIPDNDISVWVGNLDAYNNGELAGEWLPLPASEEEINAMLTRIGCMKDGELVYEYLVMDWEDNTGMGLASLFGEYGNLGELSEFAEAWENCDEQEKLAEIAPVALSWNASAQDFIELADNLDNYVYIEAATDYDLGWYYVHELGMFSDYPEEVLNYFDYEAYGRDISFDLTATKNGYYYEG